MAYYLAHSVCNSLKITVVGAAQALVFAAQLALVWALLLVAGSV